MYEPILNTASNLKTLFSVFSWFLTNSVIPTLYLRKKKNTSSSSIHDIHTDTLAHERWIWSYPQQKPGALPWQKFQFFLALLYRCPSTRNWNPFLRDKYFGKIGTLRGTTMVKYVFWKCWLWSTRVTHLKKTNKMNIFPNKDLIMSYTVLSRVSLCPNLFIKRP